MKNNLPHNPKKCLDSKGIAHLGILAVLGVLLVTVSAFYFVNKSGTIPGEEDVETDGSGYPAVTIEDNGRDVEVDLNGDEPSDNQDNQQDDSDEDKGSYTVHFNDDCVSGTQDPMTMEICWSNIWAQTCDGLYGGWEGTVHQRTTLRTDAGEDVREGTGEFSFVVNENDGKLSADKRTLTIKRKLNCYYCDDPWINVSGTISPGASGCN